VRGFIHRLTVASVVLLPPVTSVWPIESVSATTGLTSSMSSPSTSAMIIAIEMREPPISTEPVTSFAERDMFARKDFTQKWPQKLGLAVCGRKNTRMTPSRRSLE
jgi:hypothetical protein